MCYFIDALANVFVFTIHLRLLATHDCFRPSTEQRSRRERTGEERKNKKKSEANILLTLDATVMEMAKATATQPKGTATESDNKIAEHVKIEIKEIK